MYCFFDSCVGTCIVWLYNHYVSQHRASQEVITVIAIIWALEFEALILRDASVCAITIM